MIMEQEISRLMNYRAQGRNCGNCQFRKTVVDVDQFTEHYCNYNPVVNFKVDKIGVCDWWTQEPEDVE